MVVLSLDFYLGARFGPEMFWGIDIKSGVRQSLLPDGVSDEELEALLKNESQQITFHEVLENKSDQTVKSEEWVRPDDSSQFVEGSDVNFKPATTKLPQKEEPRKEELKLEVKTELKTELKKEEGRYTLQVGSFAEETKAHEVEDRMKSLGLSVFVKEVALPQKGKWYRVYVGRYPDMKEADTAKDRLYREHHVMPVVVKLNQ